MQTLVFEQLDVSQAKDEFTIGLRCGNEHYVHGFKWSRPLSNLTHQEMVNGAFWIGYFLLMDFDQRLMPQKIEIKVGSLPEWAKNFYLSSREMYAGQHFFECFAPKEALSQNIQSEGKAHNPSDRQLDCRKLAGAFGGGKESTLLNNLAKREDIPVLWMYRTTEVNEDIMTRVAQNAGLENSLSVFETRSHWDVGAPVSRTHTGISRFVVLLAMAAMDSNIGCIALGNELSANDPYCLWDGQIVNHQFDKAPLYTRQLHEFLKRAVCSDLHYFSLLAGLYEYRLSDIIAEFPVANFADIVSCNVATMQTPWCGECAKCAWTFALLVRSFSVADANRIVGINMFEKAKIYEQLMNPRLPKPFECVGERPEVWLVLEDCLEKGAIGPALTLYERNYRPKVSKWLHLYRKRYGSAHNNELMPDWLINKFRSGEQG